LNKNILMTARVSYFLWLILKNLQRTPLSANQCIEELRYIVEKFESISHLNSKECTFLEIGFGARPHRAFAAQYYFKDVQAVDLDFPLISARDFPKVWRQNGLLRATKAFVRQVFFDRTEWRDFHAGMKVLLPGYNPDKTKLIVDNAASTDFWAKAPGPHDLIFSTDVFEHIPLEDLRRTLEGIRRSLSPDGICMTYPMVFSGILGGHLPKWYGLNMQTELDPGGAWDHLIEPDFAVDTYLNRLTRRDFVKMFQEAGFEILCDRAVLGRLGEQFMTPELRERLSSWDDYELYSNRVEFVLKAI